MARAYYHQRQPSTSGPAVVATACRVAAAFPDRIPKASELRARFGMSAPTAYRWIAAMRDARGIA